MKIIGLMLFILVTSCATLSENDCKNGNWKLIGKKDGISGKPLKVISQHQEACSPYKVKVDTKEYESGRKEGLVTYCKSENGYQEGLAGHTCHNVCTSKEFIKKYKIGHKIFDLKKEISDYQKEINELESDYTMSNDDDAKIKLRYRIQKNYDKIGDLNKKITLLKVYAAGEEHELIDLF